jgi:hypothetical protein
MFQGADRSSVPESSSNWVQHTLHCFLASIDALNIGDPHTVSFVCVAPDFDLDIVALQSDDGRWTFTLNHRNFDFDWVHNNEALSTCTISKGPKCQQALAKLPNANMKICNCGVKRLFRILVEELSRQIPTIKAFTACDIQNDLLSRMPRDIAANIELDTQNREACATLSWNFLQPATGYYISFASNTIDDAPAQHSSTKTTFSKIENLPIGIICTISIKEKALSSPWSGPFTFTTVPSPSNFRRTASENGGVNVQWEHDIPDQSDVSYIVRGYSKSGDQIYEAAEIDTLTHTIALADDLEELTWLGVLAKYKPTGAESKEAELRLADHIEKEDSTGKSPTPIEVTEGVGDEDVRSLGIPSPNSPESEMRRSTPLRTASDEYFEEMDSDFEDDIDDDEERQCLEGGLPSRTESKKVLVG